MNDSGYFEIPKEPVDISFEYFLEKYFIPEQPFIIENIGKNWKAKKSWSEKYLREKLATEPSAKTASLWYWMEKDSLNDDYETPEIVDKIVNAPEVFPRSNIMRIWIHKKGNLSSWHYDANMVSVFNAQITGRKKWLLVSPKTPLDCYPFTNFGILDGKGVKVWLPT